MNQQFSGETGKISYALGMNIGASLGDFPFELDNQAVIAGLTSVLLEQPPALSQDEYIAMMRLFQQKMENAEKKTVAEVGQNTNQEADFFNSNKNVEGVIATPSGLQYIIMQEGSGPKPAIDDTVKVHYRGTLLNGTEFDSSYKRGRPAEFGVGQVIKGWTEALQNMQVGSKHKLFIPSRLAYGERGAGKLIGPNAMLIFEVELLEIV